jgi:hypothetical protein
MSKRADMQLYKAADGTHWGIDVQLPGASNVLVLFHHPDGQTARKDRYAWLNWQGSEASDVQTRVDIDAARRALDRATIEALFTRSMLVGNGRTPGFLPA